MIEELIALQANLKDLKQAGKLKEAEALESIIKHMTNGTPKGTSHGSD
jgi:hypothetical protein